jgi:hypothetical protein
MKIQTIQDAAKKVLDDWDMYCKPRGKIIIQKVEAITAGSALYKDVTDNLLTICGLNLQLGTALNLFSLKVGSITPEPDVARDLISSYNDIEKVFKSDYLQNLDTLAKELKSEHGLDELSDEVKALAKGLGRIQSSLENIRKTLKAQGKKA